uniref:Uncharacterized protein n=1 Tax=Salix viminalis TaxID=40686 RepID=A0A6N2L1A5_SALVM
MSQNDLCGNKYPMFTALNFLVAGPSRAILFFGFVVAMNILYGRAVNESCYLLAVYPRSTIGLTAITPFSKCFVYQIRAGCFVNEQSKNSSKSQTEKWKESLIPLK